MDHRALDAALAYLDHRKRDIVSRMVLNLANIPGIEAITLGGSYARKRATPDSDVDLGLYYSEPLSIEQIKQLAATYSTACIVTDCYEWGPWVNGGAWIHTSCGKVDWLYRCLDQVGQVVEEARQGLFSWDFRQQPPFGFFSVTYLADLVDNIVLYDPKQQLATLKQLVSVYPESLRLALVQEHLWSVEFSLLAAKKLAARGDVYATVGCMTRMAAELTQVLFALNRVYFATERQALETIMALAIRPDDYAKRLNALLSHPGKEKELGCSVRQFEEMVKEIMDLAQPLYQPKYIGLYRP